MKKPFWFALEALWWLIREYFQNPIGHPRSQRYAIYGAWRVQLLKRRILRLWESESITSWLGNQRWLWMLTAGAISLLFAIWLATGWPFESAIQDPVQLLRHELVTKDNKPSNAGAWSLFSILSGACIAFLIWIYRDQNNRWQIENERKDINLKDFQKLAEWASGLHLVEDKLTTIENENRSGLGLDSLLKQDLSKTRESDTEPANAVLKTNSRREGSVSLQIAAVIQLQAFLQGEFGRHFEKPAFTLITSIWHALMQKHVEVWQSNADTVSATDGSVSKQAFNSWCNQLRYSSQHTPIAKAITHALAGQHGLALRRHHELLPSLLLVGMDYRLPGLKNLELDGLNLSGIQWQCASLQFAELQGANLSGAMLHGAKLLKTKLQDANLRSANLQGADLMFTELQGANFYLANLKSAFLAFAKLQSADLSKIVFNPETSFEGSETDEATTIVIGSGYSNKKVLPLMTHATRIKLRDQNLLKLPGPQYTEYEKEWLAASEQQRSEAIKLAGTKNIYDNDPI